MLEGRRDLIDSSLHHLKQLGCDEPSIDHVMARRKKHKPAAGKKPKDGDDDRDGDDDGDDDDDDDDGMGGASEITPSRKDRAAHGDIPGCYLKVNQTTHEHWKRFFSYCEAASLSQPALETGLAPLGCKKSRKLK